MALVRLLYKPFSIVAGVLAARLGRSLFGALWSRIDPAPPAAPGSGEGTLARVVAGQALRAGVMAGAAAAVDRGFARTFHHLVGVWPKKPPAPDEK